MHAIAYRLRQSIKKVRSQTSGSAPFWIMGDQLWL